MTPTQYRQAARVRGAAQRVAAPLLLGTLLLAPVLREFVPPAMIVALAFAGLAAFIASTALGMFPLEVELEPRVVEPPVRGRWSAINSPATKVPSHGTNGYGQTYAVDLLYEPHEGARPEPEGLGFDPPERFPTFGEDVLAVADGTVVSTRSRLRDHRCRARMPALAFVYVEGFVRELFGVRFMFGNHVVLALGDGVYAAYAHLQRGSIAVRPGSRVRAGDVLARAGNSGNSTEPHLHFQLMDHPKPLYSAGLPFELPTGIPPNGEHLDTTRRLAAGAV
jgi:murein DD-endopeptidase MepM/ murein hydrolase activator NlpD